MPDQFGGLNGKKFGYPRLKTLLKGLQNMIMFDQLNSISDEFTNWQADNEQVDDVLIIGIRL